MLGLLQENLKRNHFFEALADIKQFPGLSHDPGEAGTLANMGLETL